MNQQKVAFKIFSFLRVLWDLKGNMVTAERRNKSITQNKENFILLLIDNKIKSNYHNITNNNENDDFDFDFAKPTTENEKILVHQ